MHPVFLSQHSRLVSQMPVAFEQRQCELLAIYIDGLRFEATFGANCSGSPIAMAYFGPVSRAIMVLGSGAW